MNKYGLSIPKILIPSANINLKSWSVVACDQYTQDQDYWNKVEQEAHNKPSTLHLTLPEIYLENADRPQRVASIKKTMTDYIQGSVFAPEVEGFIYIERTTAYDRMRKGLVVAIDLDCYEWQPFSKALVRATEATIVDRIPPRMEIRRDAALESPHIMLLVNDPQKTFVEELGQRAKKNSANKVYNTDLMLNSGHLAGWKLTDNDDYAFACSQLEALYKNSDFLFAVGDGNHSLATAKSVWQEFKKAHPTTTEHPLKYALVEIVNLYDDGLTFEPIHRVLLTADELGGATVDYVKNKLQGTVSDQASFAALEKQVASSTSSFGFIYTENSKTHYTLLQTPVKELAISRLQPILDTYIEENNQNTQKIKIDYIHGSDEILRLGKMDCTVAILLPPVAKDSFFETIEKSGPLPRKSFSMGEASEKRFYMECRKLVP